jgi:hypothetical protein
VLIATDRALQSVGDRQRPIALIIVASGIREPGWVSGFGGVASAPQSITVRYGHPWTAAEVDVTTYPSDPFGDLAHLVDSQAGWRWWAMTNRPARPPVAPAGEPRRRHTFTISKVDQPSSEVLEAESAQQRGSPTISSPWLQPLSSLGR